MKKLLLLALFGGVVASCAMADSHTQAVPSIVQSMETYKEMKNRFPELSGFLSFFTYLTTDRMLRAYNMNPQLFADYDKAVHESLRLLNESSQIPVLDIPRKAVVSARLAASLANLAALHAQVTALFTVAL